MATQGSKNSGGYQGRVLQFNWWTVSTSAESNVRKIGYSITAVGGSSSTYYHHNETININGNRVYTGSDSHAVKTGTTLASGEMDINQNSTMTLSVSMHGGIYSRSDNINTEESWNLDEIPRYADITSLSIVSKTINSVTIRVTTNRAANFFCSINAGANWLNNGGTFANNSTDATFTVYFSDVSNSTRLSPNTTYTFRVLSRAVISGLDRSSDVQGTTYDIAKLTEVPEVNIGEKHTIKWINPSGATTSLKLWGTNPTSLIQDFGTVTGDSKAITVPTSLYAKTPDKNQYTATYVITTTNNGESHTDYKNFICNVTNSNPTFNNFTFQDNNSTTIALTGNNQKFIRYYSGVKATISTDNKAESQNPTDNMDKYRLSVGNKTDEKTYSDTANVELNVSNIESDTFTVHAIDKRGNSTSKTLSPSTYINYDKITIQSASFERGQGGVGKTVTLKYNGTIWNGNFGAKNNKITSIKYEYKIAGKDDGNYKTGATILNPTISGNKFSQTIEIQGDLAGEGFTQANAFEIRITVKDELSDYTFKDILNSGKPLVAYHRNGVAINGPYDTSKNYAFQINGGFTCKDSLNTPLAGTSAATSFDQVGSLLKRNYMGTVNIGGTWFNLLNIRHRNGEGDGVNFGMQIVKVLTNNSTSIQTRSNYNGTWTNWEDIYRSRTLYNNTTGTTGTVTLSETSANFNYIEIFFKNNDNTYGSTKIANPNGKTTSLISYYLKNGEYAMTKLATVNISGTSITKVGYVEGNLNTETLINQWNNNTYILKVLGYK